MKKLVVEAVRHYAPGAESATVTLRSERGVIDAFCWPCNLRIGDQVENHLSALDASVRAAFLKDWPADKKAQSATERLEKLGAYAYRGVGHTLNRELGLIEALGFCIEVEEVPVDGPVEFDFPRIDIRG
jgi:hypothetical protein